MNEFTDKNEQAFLDACGAIGVEPDAMVNTQKERYLVSEFLKNPVSWLETEMLYYSYTTRGEAQEVANGIDRMINEGAPVGQSKLFPRPKHSSALSDTAFGLSEASNTVVRSIPMSARSSLRPSRLKTAKTGSSAPVVWSR